MSQGLPAWVVQITQFLSSCLLGSHLEKSIGKFTIKAGFLIFEKIKNSS